MSDIALRVENLGTVTSPGPMTAVSALAALPLSGAFYFRRMEKTFADMV